MIRKVGGSTLDDPPRTRVGTQHDGCYQSELTFVGGFTMCYPNQWPEWRAVKDGKRRLCFTLRILIDQLLHPYAIVYNRMYPSRIGDIW